MVVGERHTDECRVALMTSMTTITAAVTVVCAMHAGIARAQSLTTEAAVTTGISTEEKISAAAVQIRAFGDVKGGIRFFTEAAWGRRTHEDSDVFGAAYPYGNRVQVIEAYGERVFLPGKAVAAVRAGRYRTPFGISSGSDHGYQGFLRAPLIRYDGYFALSNNFLEHGVDVVAGVPHLTAEVSMARPADVGTAIRRPAMSAVVRIQTAIGPFIGGVSHVRTSPYLPASFAKGRSAFTGVDLRWMGGGLQLRGEWITGRPFDGAGTTGWYADAMVHRLGMGPVTAVARLERLRYDPSNPAFSLHAGRQMVGARVRFFEALSAQLNVVHQTGELAEYGATALEVGVTYSRRHSFHRD
jgi:hypothetical protein